MSTLGERLRIARERKGLKQTQVKERTNINNKTLSGYEHNVSEPDSNTLATLADLYEVSYKWLMTGKGEPSEEQKGDELTEKDERDIAKRMAKLREDLMNGEDSDGLSFSGEPMSPEAIESLLEALEYAERQATRINKKYTPKKYRNKEEK
ncbi:helix-turn-helix transcriptional regulator [Bacillaceae bacterium SIJ1]|uniref:helix-turn-helix domain-containing protein n=1 Tax=Litoribacterium kuwaitense TaxID=1398745 RepID=UPI0013EBBC18|nr:helix-turn-helix transcriptional regulator [Litoribacterium kuwaitense]NGP46016.1 helix-turn-helix transcriptional regulator [Litoribacterium kuwaitense]